jgi:hypothetical protein
MMPTGQTPTPVYKRGQELAYGDATEANRGIVETVSSGDEQRYEPSGEEDGFIYGRTDRPSEPVTQGAPVGPGANVTRNTMGETDDEFLGRVIGELEARAVSPQVKRFVERAKLGL